MSNKLWGGRFSKEVDASITGWTESVTVDSKMVVEDIWGSMAHVSMLGVKGIIPPKDAAAILSKLLEFQDGYVAGSWQLQLDREDVHMNVEARLIDVSIAFIVSSFFESPVDRNLGRERLAPGLSRRSLKTLFRYT
jgi:argininosuccinate lyase